MTTTSRLYDAMNAFLSQCDIQWRDVRHLKTLCWRMVGMIESQNVHLNGFGVYINSRAQIAQSHQRRLRRCLSNRRIDISAAHQALMAQALSTWGKKRLYLRSGYDNGVELFLCYLGRGGLSRTHRGRRLADRPASQQYRQVMGNSTRVATSRTDASG